MKYGTKFGLFQILTHWYQFCSNWKCLFNRNSIIEFYIARNFHGSPDRFDRWNLILQTVRWITRKYLFCPNWLWLESNKILEIRPKSRDLKWPMKAEKSNVGKFSEFTLDTRTMRILNSFQNRVENNFQNFWFNRIKN